mmetsp:Transcript_63/g.233  ORF Transcript_63/g.233 Transcript_63/m.233 type:complete len:278 (-) Transcript_63:1110-1943(-)
MALPRQPLSTVRQAAVCRAVPRRHRRRLLRPNVLKHGRCIVNPLRRVPFFERRTVRQVRHEGLIHSGKTFVRLRTSQVWLHEGLRLVHHRHAQCHLRRLDVDGHGEDGAHCWPKHDYHEDVLQPPHFPLPQEPNTAQDSEAHVDKETHDAAPEVETRIVLKGCDVPNLLVELRYRPILLFTMNMPFPKNNGKCLGRCLEPPTHDDINVSNVVARRDIQHYLVDGELYVVVADEDREALNPLELSIPTWPSPSWVEPCRQQGSFSSWPLGYFGTDSLA